MGLIGRPPIHPALFVIAKCALVPPHLFLAWAAVGAARHTLTWPWLAPFAALAVVVGSAVAGIGVTNLGTSVRVGLPHEATSLRTGGLYRISRNPIYAGLFLSMIGSCLLVPHGLNLASTVTAIVLHDRIVRAEEVFLEGRFGQAWRDYRAQVRRYC